MSLELQPRSQVDLPPSNECPSYEMLECLGHGQFADVYRCTRDNKFFACKMFQNTEDGLEEVREEFDRIDETEANIMGRLSGHQHIVQIIETFTSGRNFYIIMTPVADIDLHWFLLRIRDGKWDRDALRAPLYKAFGCLSKGLDYIHEKKIRHKDIKPENILYSSGSWLFADFGISQEFSGHTGLLTTTSPTPQNTPRYCPPESVNSRHFQVPLPQWFRVHIVPVVQEESTFARDLRSDVFSLGCTFHEILAILEPDQIIRVKHPKCYYQCVKSLRKNLSEASPDGSLKPLLNFCSKMIHPDRGKRPHPLATKLTELLREVGSGDDTYFCDGCNACESHS